MKSVQEFSVEEQAQHLWKIATIVAIIAHSVWSIIFILTDAWILAAANFVTCLLLTAGMFFLIEAGRCRLHSILLMMEIMVNPSLSTFLTEWDAGFHYFVFTAVYAVIFLPSILNVCKMLAVLGNLALYLALYHLTLFQFAPYYEYSDQMIRVFYHVNVSMVFIIVFIMASLFRATVDKGLYTLTDSNKKLSKMAGTDPLTGLLNRRTMYGHLHEAMEKEKKDHTPFSILLMDVDNFKKFNDTYGHECGDIVLKTCSELLSKAILKEDVVSRWGGEEFLILLNGADEKEGVARAEQLRMIVEKQQVVYEGEALAVTMTIGCAQYNGEAQMEKLINRADRMLIKGKSSGKNKVLCAKR
ncbi:hypothetical protein BTO30_10680 [Domibacillus antri]|uniref:GGDEF domain-containing protein n=1 Tax=Domibacillus antri TaxID=1714264 RepID=A0A1Q8Q4C3_9BACI|nr:GGDEF domain-containing protein [Domibacillus antri]OLN22206.1 hypothetical protein BTO30_10680 [Domibacillus antri]